MLLIKAPHLAVSAGRTGQGLRLLHVSTRPSSRLTLNHSSLPRNASFCRPSPVSVVYPPTEFFSFRSPSLRRCRALGSKSAVGGQTRWLSSQKEDESKDHPRKGPQTTTQRILSKLPVVKSHENIYTIPNILTFSRLVAAPVVGYLLVHDYHAAALSLFAYAGITDLVDGWIARKYHLQTVVGTIIDPMADKLLMTIGVACLATMARYWDFSLPSAEVKPTEISKINTALQLVLVGSAIALPVVPEAIISTWHLSEAMTGFQYLVAATTVWSGLSYVFSNNAVKILTKEEIQKRIAQAEAKRKH
ncbi:cardiolipin synthase (CMP-forming) [Penicillium diatomitis]|uniref:Cardiolipin synthase (CMP-forming) n=1 Tax=Penicillium diatomitis TaxID=2819901 RepID=A0A9X0BUK3_9EURO|nr:cardiolipin synthase (CMP-forming) [Penicillium diatomitis]KAJ5484951.1 cardiolipin synthase (CMP-forming) [Penicillium diatomitis]